MTTIAKRLCLGCKRPCDGARCEECRARHVKRVGQIEGRRKRAADQEWSQRFYRTAAWLRCRRHVLSDSPLCVECKAEGHETLAVDLHHDEPCSQSSFRNLDPTNLIPLCKKHHTRIENSRRQQ